MLDYVVLQGYGLTESSGGIFRFANPHEERIPWRSVGRLTAIFEAKIVDPDTGTALPPCKQGELWVKGPAIMKGIMIGV